MAKEITIIDGVAKLHDPKIDADYDKSIGKKPKDMTAKEQIEFLFAYLCLDINENIKPKKEK